MLVAGCGSAQGTATPPTSSSPVSTGAPSDEANPTEPAQSEPASPDPDSATPPEDAPTPSIETSPSVDAGPASDCTGTEENRLFYGSVAAAVDWTVYCPVLPSGWYVETGQYRLASGGRLDITYRGPGGARFALDEGQWCSDGTGCRPAGAEVGPTTFGDRTGTLIATDDGNYAIVVDAGSATSWSLVGAGVDEATMRMFGAALIAVGD